MSYVRNVEPMRCGEPTEMCAGVSASPRPAEPLKDMMGSTNEVGLAILAMADKINANLFGIGPCGENEDSPMCLRDAMEIHRRTLERAADTLRQVCDLLGI